MTPSQEHNDEHFQREIEGDTFETGFEQGTILSRALYQAELKGITEGRRLQKIEDERFRTMDEVYDDYSAFETKGRLSALKDVEKVIDEFHKEEYTIWKFMKEKIKKRIIGLR